MIDVRLDDLAFAAGDAIAWPVTAELRPTTPLLRRVEAAGGAPLAALLHVHEPLPVGSAVVTGAGDLAVELLVSAIVTSETEPVSASSVRRALTSALQRGADWQIGHLLCPLFGLGAGNLDIEESAEIMIETLTRHRAPSPYPSRITVVVETALEQEAFEHRLTRVAR